MSILILTDYLGAFYSSTKNTRTLCTMDIEKIKDYFIKLGYSIVVESFSTLDLQADYSGVFVIYTSSEDEGLKYKSFIEDVILFLKEKGAILIPDYKFLRAHHNKLFMELLRYRYFPEDSGVLNTKIFGTLEELINSRVPLQKYVIKSAYGAGSKYVSLSNNQYELYRIARKLSRVSDLSDIVKELYKRLRWKKYSKHSLNRNKFIIQNYVEGLNGDFKVLRYGRKYYTLYRENRKDDFRASGSGKLHLEMPLNIDENLLLDFAKNISDKFAYPLCSMDIAFDGKKFILLEFQSIHFGPYTAENSNKYHINEDGVWKTIEEKCDLELVFCEAISDYIKNYSE